jgi:hypothetical protein
VLPGGVNWGGLGLGCDDPNRRLSPEEKERCLKRWKPGQQVAELAPLIAKEGKIEFDRRIHCRNKYDNASIPIGAAETMQALLGYNPSFKECPPADR